MAKASIFDIDKQFTFYGAYHANPVNVAVHITFVPILLWTGFVIGAHVPWDEWGLPSYHKIFFDQSFTNPLALIPFVEGLVNRNVQLTAAFDLNWSSVVALSMLSFWYTLEPLAAFLYTPLMASMTLTSLGYSHQEGHLKPAVIIHIVSWIMQVLAHQIFEGRAPALLDNLVQAIALAPFFVFLEVLYMLGYKPALHKRIQNEIGKEITRVRKAEGSKRRATEAAVSSKND
ncbi:DUF962-domain-containing protein [Cylindrobasidium torrendii FP15055 ss-10]|uniref:DUF962-domain-containing protein n=1 Tax=Cylindrobasidium torrendii FP15055 ss-10 TaxID=1314674 RepID=A0A0D7BU75_9AGAR|nr:DUF962-domain-containing protein [Cylindrobasidium torrendii FP15055 ss-10]